MRKKLTMLLASLFLMLGTVWAQAPVATAEQAITGLLNRIGGNGTADKFEIVIDASLAEDGKDVFVITSQNGKPCIKGNTQLSVATGINWYLNHYAHINLTWNNLTTDLSQVTLPVPTSEEKHVCNTTYRYDFNTCTFSYSMAFWTWERWQQEIDWMALHGINAPLNLVGLDVVTRKFLRELGVSENDINAYIAGPGFIAWFAMNNLEGWGGTINATDVTMNGNPDWWYTRQEQLCRNMLQRMRELGMQPVIPGFSGQVPNCIVNYSINGFSSGDVVNNGTWAGGYTRPDILKPNTESYRTFAAVYYKHLHEVMGVSELYSIDPFHEGSLPSGVSNETCYPNIMVELDNYYNGVSQEDKAKNNVDEQPKWIIQYWQGVPQSGAFSAMSSYGDRFIGLDLFSDAPGKAKWNTDYFQGRPYIFCMLHNFGGRSGMHGRLESTMNDYFRALAKGNNCKGIGATPEGTETNPVLYDMLFELPWMDVNNRPTADEWLEDYAYSRYGVQNNKALAALKNLKKSVWACPTDQQGTSEAVILARPNWTIGSVSSWSTAAIYWDTQDVLLAADELSSISDLITTADGTANYNYDFIDVVRQAMVDYAAELLPLINAARDDDAEYTRLYQLYLQLMLDLDEMLSYDENFKLERWTSLARNIANEVSGTTENDRRWLEWNARTQVTVWSKGNTDLHDYSNRCWAGLIKDFHYKRWEKFFTTKGGSFSGGWFSGFEYPWTVDFTNYNYSTVTIPNDMTATAKAKQTFGKYFGRVVGKGKNYLFPMGVTTNAAKSDVVAEVYRGQTVDLPLIIGKNVTISSLWIDLNNDGAKGNGETLTATNNKVAIPKDAAIGKTTAQVVYSDGTDITFNLALVEDISAARTVTAVAGANGSVAIEGTNELSVTNKDAVKMTATANTGYNFANWTDAAGNVVSNDNPFIYYGKEAATFTANFIQDKWGVVACNGSFSGDIAGYAQFIHNLTFAYHNREAETILETTTAPTEIFNTISKIVNVPQGASFTVSYDNGNSDGLKYCYFRAFIDLNQDGDFDDEGELLKETGTNGAQNAAVCSGSMNVVLPYDMPLGITHMRLRFDGAWDNGNKPSGRGPKDASIRPVYELVINVTEFSDKAAHIIVASNNDEWGTAKVWTDETPDGSTRTEWDVTKGVPFFIAATKASEDVEFLGWYDQYDRLLTENLNHTMYAREDATYTARFHKALVIDGWQFEYRTEPGDELRVKGELGSTAPVGGKMYYIYAKTNGGNYYLYNNNGSLATETQPNGNAYIWVATADGNYLTFENLAQSGKYIGYGNTGKGLTVNTTPVKLDISSTEAVTSDCVGIKRVGDDADGKYMVVKNNGSEFNRNSVKTNGDYSSDYVFVEITAPDVVILTSVRQSGNHDLVIPETVEILGEQCKIIGFDNNLFNNNKDLWSIRLPQTIEFLSSNTVFETSLNGNITPSTGGDALDSNKSQLIDLGGYALAQNKVWTLNVSFETEGKNSLYNKWGTILLSGGNNASNNQWFYLSANGNGYLRLPGFGSLYNDNNDALNFFYEHTNGKIATFTVSIANQGNGTAIVTVINSEGVSKSSNAVNFNPNGYTQLSSYITKGVNITKLEITEGSIPNPFSGCSNLGTITFDGDCANYYVSNDGDLYNANQVLVCSPEGKGKADAIRTLGELIDNTKALMDVIAASVDATGKATGLPLTTEQGKDFYVSTNADQNTGGGKKDGDGIAALVDNNEGTYFHTRWGGTVVNEPHYIQVDLGANNLMNNFKFTYKPRNGSPAPTAMTVYGSSDGVNFTNVLATINSGLPAHDSGKTYVSAAIDSKKYRYLRFTVTNSVGPGGNNYGGQYFFGMLEFDLFKLTSIVEVDTEYQELAGITNDEAAEVYDNLVNALCVYNNDGTAAELQAAYDALEPLYRVVNEKKCKVDYVRELNELIPATNALIKAIATSDNRMAELDLTTTENEDFYVSTNADQNTGGGNKDGAGIAGLVDGSVDTYFHSRWGGTAVNAPHHIKVDLGEGNEMSVFKFSYVAHNAPDPTEIAVKGSNNGTDFVLIETITKNVTAVGATYTSKDFVTSEPYRYLLFEVTNSSRGGFNASFGDYKCFGMKEFYLYKSSVEVAPVYKNLAGITNEEATAAYDNMVTAQALCSNGTATDLKAALDALKTSYETLNAKKSKVLNGVYHINFDGANVFVAHTDAIPTLSNDAVGYKLFDAKVENTNTAQTSGSTAGTTTNETLKTLQNNAITKKVAADELFTIVPNSEGTGYTISAQGLYLHSTRNGGWAPQLLSADANQAGVFLVEESAVAGLYKLKSNRGDIQYINDWGPVFGNDKSNKNTGLSIFSFNPVTEYTINVTSAKMATLCLPFNVVLPEGMVAYDLAASRITNNGNVAYAYMDVIAEEGDILRKGTPVIIQAEKGEYKLAITMDDTDAKGALEGSLLRGNFVSQALTPSEPTAKLFIFANGEYGVGFYLLDTTQATIGANKCWLEWKTTLGQVANSISLRFGDDTTDVEHIETSRPTQLVIYNILGQRLDAPQKGINIINGKKVLIK